MTTCYAVHELTDSKPVDMRACHERELIESAARGEADAVRHFYRRHHQQVRAFAQRLLGSDADAEELVQEVFVSLPSLISRYRGDSTLSAFILGIAANHARHHLRSRQRRLRMLKYYAEHNFRLLEQTATPDEALGNRQLAHRLLRAMEELNAQQRMAFILCEVENRTSSEAASILGLPPSTIRAQVSAARTRLRRILQLQEQP